MKNERHRRELTGTVISDKMTKTIIVETSSHVTHPKYQKIMLRRAKFAAHDEKNAAKMGDVVKIRESRPLSRTKRWALVEVLRQVKLPPEQKVVRARKKKAAEDAAATEAAV